MWISFTFHQATCRNYMPSTLKTTSCLKLGSRLWGKRSTSGSWARPGYVSEFVRHLFGSILAILIRFPVLATLDPTAHVCLLTSDTEVIVAPKPRKNSDTNPTELDKSEATGPLTCAVRVLPARLFPDCPPMRDDPTVCVSTATMEKLATKNIKEVYVTRIGAPFKSLLESLKHHTPSTSTPANNVALKHLREVDEAVPAISGKEEKPDPIAVLSLSALPPNTALVANLSQVHDWGFIKSVCYIIPFNGTHDIRHRLSSAPPESKVPSSNEKYPDSTIPFLL